jgi:hypothetical protein
MTWLEFKLALIFALFGVTFLLRWILGKRIQPRRRRRLWRSERTLPRPSGREM